MNLQMNKHAGPIGLLAFLLLTTLLSFAQDNDPVIVKPSKDKKNRKREITYSSPRTPVSQIDSPIYEVKLKANKEYFCNIIAMADGNYMTIKTYDGRTRFLQWDEIDSYRLTPYNANSHELVALKKGEDLRQRYDNWGYCYLIKSKGDTLRGRIKNVADYSVNIDGIVYPEIVMLDEKKGTANSVDFKLYDRMEILGRDDYKFLLCCDDEKEIYKILVDGPCKLLYSEVRSGAGFMMTGNGGSMPVMPQDRERYFIYMNHALIKMRAESNDNIFMPTVTTNFKNKCKEIFRACPVLLEKIENNTLRSNNLVEIVTEFNNCIAHK